MNAWTKTVCMLAVTLTFAACSKDDPKRADISSPPSTPQDQQEVLKPEAQIEEVPGDSVLGSGYYSVTVQLPNGEGTSETEYSVLLSGEAGSDETIRNMNVNGVEDILTQARALGSDIEALMVTRFASEMSTEGTAYIFVRNQEGQMELVQEVQVDPSNTSSDIAAVIESFAETNQVSVSQAILQMVEAEEQGQQEEQGEESSEETQGTGEEQAQEQAEESETEEAVEE